MVRYHYENIEKTDSCLPLLPELHPVVSQDREGNRLRDGLPHLRSDNEEGPGSLGDSSARLDPPDERKNPQTSLVRGLIPLQ